MDKMKKIATLVVAAAALSFVAVPMVAVAAKVKCYGVDTCKGKGKNCKPKTYIMTSAKRCTKLNGTTTEPTTTTTTTTSNNTGNTGTTTTTTGTAGTAGTAGTTGATTTTTGG